LEILFSQTSGFVPGRQNRYV